MLINAIFIPDMNYSKYFSNASSVGKTMQSFREYPRTCNSTEYQRDSTKYSRKREDPLMSDLMWEKVDTDDECIPRMKHSHFSSEDEASHIEDDNSYYNSNGDSVKSGEFTSLNSSRLRKSTTRDNNADANNPNISRKNAPFQSTTKTKPGQKRSRKRNQNNIHLKSSQQTEKQYKNSLSLDSSRGFASDRRLDPPEREEGNSTSSTSLSTPTKTSRQHKLDATKKVSELLTQQLSIMWCLKEFEPNSSDKLVDSDHKKNVLGQVIQQGRDIYFEPALHTSPESRKEIPSTSRPNKTHRSKNEMKSDLESGEIESDSTSISVDNQANKNHIKKKKKSKKFKRRNVSKRTKASSRSSNAFRSRCSLNKNTDRPNIRHSRNRYSNHGSFTRKETICSEEGNDTSSYDEELFTSKSSISGRRSSQFSHSLNTRSRSVHRSIQCKGGNR